MRIGRLTSNELVVIRDGMCHDASAARSVLAPQTWPYPKGDQFIANLDIVVAAIDSTRGLRTLGTAAAASFGSPVANPTKVVGAPVNYQSHVDEAQSNLAAFPHAVARIQQAGHFLKAASSLIGPGDGVALRFPDRRTQELSSWASAFYTLNPGDVIMTGTPSGVGPVSADDEIVATIERIGTMRVKARAIAAASEPAAAAARNVQPA